MKRKQGRPPVAGKSIYMRVPHKVHAEIKRRATAEGRSMSWWIQRALAQAVQGGK